MEQGYAVISGNYSEEELNALHTTMKQEVINILFGLNSAEHINPNIEFKFDINDMNTWKLFTSAPFRRKILQNPSQFWKVRNHPLSRTTGMIDIHHNKLIHELVQFDPRMYNILSQAYEIKELIHYAGPEKFCIKPPDSQEMKKHIDANLWHPENNYPNRIQSFLAVNVPTEGKINEQGGLCVLQNFHHYWSFASALFHYETGLYPMPKSTSRFHVLPKNFDSYYLPLLIDTIKQYMEKCPKNSTINEFFKKISTISLPEEYQEIKWKYVEYKKGDVVMWHQHLPHFSAKNNTNTLRSVIYYSVFPIGKDFYNSERRNWLREQFEKNTFYYDTQANILTHKIRNPEEVVFRNTKKSEVYKQDEFTRKLAGIDSWF